MADEIQKIDTPRGDGRSMTSLQPTMVAAAGDGASWFGPSLPLRPSAPDAVAGRRLDYDTGINLSTQPRVSEEVSFADLRALASAYDPVALVISRRLDQITRLPWSIRVRSRDGGKRASATELSPQLRGKIRQIGQLFRNPCRDLSFRPWLRALLNDLLVIDQPALYCRRDGAGNLVALEPIDGGTIKRVLDEWGRTPEPILFWDGSSFDFCGEQVTVDNYHQLGFRLTGSQLHIPAYQQILKGLPAVNYTTHDLLVRPLNIRTDKIYGCSPVQMIVQTVATATRRAVSQLSHFTSGNLPEGVFGLPETWNVDQVAQFQEHWDSLFLGNAERRRQVRFMAGDGRWTPFKEPPLKTEFDEWLIRIVCFAFSYPPAAFVALSNRSIAEQHEKQAEEEGVETLKQWFEDLANHVIDAEFNDGAADDVEFAWTEEQEIDPVKQAEIIRGYVTDGLFTINMGLEKLGEKPSADPAADRHMVKTATGYVPISGAAEVTVDDGDDVGKLSKRGAIVMKPPPG